MIYWEYRVAWEIMGRVFHFLLYKLRTIRSEKFQALNEFRQVVFIFEGSCFDTPCRWKLPSGHLYTFVRPNQEQLPTKSSEMLTKSRYLPIT